MDEATLIEKLLKIEALFAGAATEGERTSAGLARRFSARPVLYTSAMRTGLKSTASALTRT